MKKGFSKINSLKMDTTRFAYLFLLSGTLLWSLLIPAAPYLAHKHSFISGFVYLFFSKICHQIPGRCLFVFGNPMAVCARCTGIYFGFLSGILLYPLIFGFKKMSIPSKPILLIIILPTAVDLVFAYTHIWTNTAASRFLMGILLGAPIAFFIVPGFCNSVKFFADHFRTKFISRSTPAEIHREICKFSIIEKEQ